MENETNMLSEKEKEFLKELYHRFPQFEMEDLAQIYRYIRDLEFDTDEPEET